MEPISIYESASLRPSGPRRILVTKLDHIGDFIIGLPALRALRQAFVRDHITLICGKWNYAAAAASRLVDDVRQFDFFPEQAQGWSGQPIEDFAAFDAAAAGSFDIAIDLRVDGDTRALLKRVDATIKCGIGSRRRFEFLDIILPVESAAQDSPDYQNLSIPPLTPDRFNSRLDRKGPLFHEGRNGSARGHLIFGPYIQLPQGVYRASFGLRATGLYVWPFARLTIEAALDNTVVAAARLRRKDLSALPGGPTLLFENADSNGKLELRVRRSGWSWGGRLFFSGVQLEAVGALPASSNPKPELHVGEQLSLLVELIVQRLRLGSASAAPAPETCPATTVLTHLPPGPKIVIAPLSNSTLRDWPIDSYRHLIQGLLEETPCQVVLVGAPSQIDAIGEIAKAFRADGRVVDLSGQTSRDELPMMLAEADLVICNNSGVAHMAAEQGASTLALYSGSHHPRQWGPRGPHVRTIIAEVACSPCGRDRLEDCPKEHLCMSVLTPEIVLSQAKTMLAARDPRAVRAFSE